MQDLVKIENVQGNNQIVVSSRDVATNFGKEHSKVLRSIRDILGQADFGQAPMFYEHTYIDEQNKQEYREYLMNRDGFSLLVMSFTGKKALEWKIKYIKAFNEMEKTITQQLSVPQNYAEALRAFADQVEKRELIQQQLKEVQPKVDYYDKYLNSDGLITTTSIASEYGLSARKLNDILRDEKIQYKQGDLWILKQPYDSKGFARIMPIVITDKNGKDKTYQSLKWTAAGKMFIESILLARGYSKTTFAQK